MRTGCVLMMQGAFVSVGGALLNDAMVRRVEVRQRLNEHWFCEIECRDTLGSPIPGEDALGSDCSLSNTGEDGTQHLIFSGIVIDVALRQEVWGSYTATLLAASRSWLIDHSPRNEYFSSGSISQAAGTLAASAGGAACNLSDKTSPAELVQYGETNWQFLLRLADDHAGWIRAGLGQVELNNTFDSAKPLAFRDHYGLLEFYIEGQLGDAKVESAQYDSAAFTSHVSAGEQKTAEFEAPGQKMAGAVASASSTHSLLGSTTRSRSSTVDDMLDNARSEAERSHGSGVLAGGTSRDQTLTAGGAIDVQNLGEANGTFYLLAVTHLWTTSEYINHFVATPWKQWRGPARPRPAVAPGVQVGRIVGNNDPLQRGRLSVQLFWQEGGNLLWAPMTSLHCGAGFGLTVMPEIGDEVLVGFIDADPERPVILGSLWNGVHQPPRDQFATADEHENNLVKRLVTKSGIRIHLVDTPGQESISLATPRSNHLILSEKVAETGRPALAFYTQGDIHLRAAGRIHEQASFRSSHVDGKVMHPIGISLTDFQGNSSPYIGETLHASLTDGSSSQAAISDGQHFPSIPQGNCQFHFPDFYKATPGDPPEGVS